MDKEIYDCFENIEPEVKQRLQSKEAYQSLLLKRAVLEDEARDEFKRSGRLTSNKIDTMKKEVEELGMQVLNEIKDIRFMLSEISFEDLQTKKKE